MLRSGTDRSVRVMALRTLDGPFRAKLRQMDHEGSATFSAVDLKEIVSHQCTPKQELGLAGRRDQFLSTRCGLAQETLTWRGCRCSVRFECVDGPPCHTDLLGTILDDRSRVGEAARRPVDLPAGDITPGVERRPLPELRRHARATRPLRFTLFARVYIDPGERHPRRRPQALGVRGG